MRLEVAHGSHMGVIRSYNQDTALVLRLDVAGEVPTPELLLALVADGMGGHSNGGLASSMAARAVLAGVVGGMQSAPLEGLHTCSREQLVDLMNQAIAGAGSRINEAAQYGLSDMGTTLVTGLFLGSQVLIANVGDSRCYLLHGDTMQLITEDHSLVQRLVEQGDLTPEEARVHPRRNEIYNLLGLGHEPAPDFFWLDLQGDDTLLFCSDGLNTMLPDEEIAGVLLAAPSPQAAVDALIAAANLAGGEDNVTALVIKVWAEEEAEAP